MGYVQTSQGRALASLVDAPRHKVHGLLRGLYVVFGASSAMGSIAAAICWRNHTWDNCGGSTFWSANIFAGPTGWGYRCLRYPSVRGEAFHRCDRQRCSHRAFASIKGRLWSSPAGRAKDRVSVCSSPQAVELGRPLHQSSASHRQNGFVLFGSKPRHVQPPFEVGVWSSAVIEQQLRKLDVPRHDGGR
jgi:hypothetical protein